MNLQTAWDKSGWTINVELGIKFAPPKSTRLRCMTHCPLFPVCGHHSVNWLQRPSDSPCLQVTSRGALLQCHHHLGVADSCLVSWQHKLGSFPSWRKDNCSRTQCLHQRWKEQSIVQNAKVSIVNIWCEIVIPLLECVPSDNIMTDSLGHSGLYRRETTVMCWHCFSPNGINCNLTHSLISVQRVQKQFNDLLQTWVSCHSSAGKDDRHGQILMVQMLDTVLNTFQVLRTRASTVHALHVFLTFVPWLTPSAASSRWNK